MGKVVLITGASSGLGKATAELLSERCYRVFGTGRDAGKIKDGRFEVVDLNVDYDESADSCVGSVIEKAGGLDVLVSNAGSGLLGATEEVTVDQARDFFNTNFFGTLRMVKAVLPQMRNQRDGRIVVMSSGAVAVPGPFNAFYTSAKSALEAYSEALRFEVASLNIKVSLLEPAYFKTSFGNSIKFPAEKVDAYEKIRNKALQVMQERGINV